MLGVAHSLAAVQRSKFLPLAVLMFVVGLAAIIAIFVFAGIGMPDQSPLLYVAAMFLPIGLALGILTIVRSR